MTAGTHPNIFPALRYEEAAAAIDWLEGTFGFQQEAVHRDDDGTVRHAELRLGAGLIMLGQYSDEGWMGGNRADPLASTLSLYVVVDDPDAHHRRTTAAGARSSGADRSGLRVTRVQRTRPRGQPLVVRHLRPLRRRHALGRVTPANFNPVRGSAENREETQMAAPYTLKKLIDVEDSAASFGFSEFQEARFAKDDLEAENTGVSHHRLKAGKRQPFAHKHDGAEEVYVVLSGSGRVKLDDEIVEIETRDAIRVAPGVIRAFESGSDGLELLAVGPRHDGDGELIQDWWTD